MLAAPIGHNNPPSFEEILADKHAGLLETASAIILDAEALPKLIDDPKQAESITDFIKQANDTAKKLEGVRVAEKEPYLTGGKKVDAFFKGHTDCLESVIKRAKVPLTKYLDAEAEKERQRLLKEAEEQRKAAEAAAQQAAALEKAGDEESATAAQEAADKAKAEAAATTNAANGSGLVKTTGQAGSAGLTKRWVGEVEDYAVLDLNKLRGCFSEDAIQKAINCYVAAGHRELSGVRIYQKSSVNVR